MYSLSTPPLFASESDRWLSSLILFFSARPSTLSLSTLTVSSLPSPTLAHMFTPHGTIDPEGLADVGEWCLQIITHNVLVEMGLSCQGSNWSIDPSHQIITDIRILDRVCFALLTGERFGEVLERWRRTVRMLYRVEVN